MFSPRVDIEQSVNSRGKADHVVEFIRSNSERGEKLRLLLKEIEKPKFKPAQIVEMMHQEGFRRFKGPGLANWKSMVVRP